MNEAATSVGFQIEKGLDLQKIKKQLQHTFEVYYNCLIMIFSALRVWSLF